MLTKLKTAQLSTGFGSRSYNRRTLRVSAMTGQHHPAMPAVVTPQWLKERLHEVKVLDTSWYLPPMGRDAAKEFTSERIQGAQFWDIDGVCDPSSDLPHMLPTEEAFAAAADALGISNDDAVVVYDGMGVFAAPRAWWTWRVFGHDRVAVLEGGLPAWKAAGGPVDTTAAPPEALSRAKQAARQQVEGATKYKAHLKHDKVCFSLSDMRDLVAPAAAAAQAAGQAVLPLQAQVRSLQEMRDLVAPAAAAVAAGQEVPPLQAQIVDARPPGRFRGVEPEPRPGLKRGHMPGALNVPFVQVYEGGVMAGARLKAVDELQDVFEAAGVDVQAPLVCSCGSGLTACVVALALHQVTGQLAAVYDGSWSEWGDPALDTPVVSEA